LVKNLSNLKTAYLLVAHGSRDPRPQKDLRKLANLVSQYLQENDQDTYFPLVDIATLEFSSVSFSQTMINFAEIAYYQGYKQIKIIPLFLSAGVHVTEDIFQSLVSIKANINLTINLILEPYLGSYPEIIDILDLKFQLFSDLKRILFAHGSRKNGANFEIENLATALGALNAYWFISPSLEEQVHYLVKQGVKRIVVVPYLLFMGGITEAITQKINLLQQDHPDVKIFLDSPLGATPALAQLIAKKIKQ